MIKIQIISDKIIWESFLDSSIIKPIFFQGWTWGELERSRGKDVFNIGFYEAEKLVGVALSVLVNAKRGKFLHVRGGPVIDYNSDIRLDAAYPAIIDFAKSQKCDFLRISPNIYKTDNDKVESLKKLGFKSCQMHDVDAEVTWVLDLLQSEEEILKGMRDSTRYLIKKGLKNSDLKIIQTKDLKYLDDFWRIYQETVSRQKWNAYSYNYIKEEFIEYLKNDEISLFLAEYRGEFIAASLFIYYKGQAFYHHSGSLTAYRNIPAMYLLHWESIKEAKKKGCDKYNFFGIARDNNPKHPWAGLSLFKKGFGGQQVEMVHAMDFPITKKYWITNTYEKLEKKLRGY